MGWMTAPDGTPVHTSAIHLTEPLTVKQIDLLELMIDAYTDINVTGGSLHVVLDEGCWNTPSLLSCRDYAQQHDDPFGEVIAAQLLHMPDDLYAQAEAECVLNGVFDTWRARVKLYWDNKKHGKAS